MLFILTSCHTIDVIYMLVIILSPMETVPSWSLKASSIIHLGNILNSVRENKHPWRTSTCVWNQSPLLQCSGEQTLWSLFIEFVYHSDKVIVDALLLYGGSQDSRGYILSKSFLMSKTTWYRSRFTEAKNLLSGIETCLLFLQEWSLLVISVC